MRVSLKVILWVFFMLNENFVCIRIKYVQSMCCWSLSCSPLHTFLLLLLELCVLPKKLQQVSVSLSGSIWRTYRCPCLCFLLLFLHCCTWPWFVLLDRGDEKRGSRGLPLSQCLIHEDKPVPSRSTGFSTSRSLSWPLVAEILNRGTRSRLFSFF